METRKQLHSDGSGCTVTKRMQYASEAPNEEELRIGPNIAGKYCLTHQIVLCHCGSEWNHPHFHVETDVRTVIKKRCFLCGKKLQLSTKRYKLRGNCCKMCEKRTNQFSLGKLSTEQADAMLEQRRIKYNFV